MKRNRGEESQIHKKTNKMEADMPLKETIEKKAKIYVHTILGSVCILFLFFLEDEQNV